MFDRKDDGSGEFLRARGITIANNGRNSKRRLRRDLMMLRDKRAFNIRQRKVGITKKAEELPNNRLG